MPKGALPSGEASPTPTQPATAGSQSPVTIHVAAHKPANAATRSAKAGQARAAPAAAGGQGAGVRAPRQSRCRCGQARTRTGRTRTKRLRLAGRTAARFARRAGHRARSSGFEAVKAPTRAFVFDPSRRRPEPRSTHGRFSPTGSNSTPALHPQGAKAGRVSPGPPQPTPSCSRTANWSARCSPTRASSSGRATAAGGSRQGGPRTLALLVYLSRSGLKPTVGELRCGRAVTPRRGSDGVPGGRDARHRRDQRRGDRRSSGRGDDHRRDDPYAADGQAPLRPQADRQPDAATRARPSRSPRAITPPSSSWKSRPSPRPVLQPGIREPRARGWRAHRAKRLTPAACRWTRSSGGAWSIRSPRFNSPRSPSRRAPRPSATRRRRAAAAPHAHCPNGGS